MLKKAFYCMMAMGMICIFGLSPAMAQAVKHKVLVVFSYEETYPWTLETKEGIDSVMADSCEMKYFHMDTKINFEGGEQKAKDAYALYQEFQPDGIIVAEDNAQFMFVVPYLKDKIKTPVMFCGVNADPEKYGYPASNVSGILERQHMHESIALLKQLVPSVKSIGYIVKESATARGVFSQIEKESDSYPIKSGDFKMPEHLKETLAMTEELREKNDALFIMAVQGILDDNGNPLKEDSLIPLIAKTFGKPTISGDAYSMKYGILCGIIPTGQEQGETSAKMLLKAMQGTPVSEIPITRNHHGKAMINVTTMKALGIRPNPRILHTAELVKTEE